MNSVLARAAHLKLQLKLFLISLIGRHSLLLALFHCLLSLLPLLGHDAFLLRVPRPVIVLLCLFLGDLSHALFVHVCCFQLTLQLSQLSATHSQNTQQSSHNGQIVGEYVCVFCHPLGCLLSCTDLARHPAVGLHGPRQCGPIPPPTYPIPLITK